MDRKAKWMKTGYIKHEVYDRLSVVVNRISCTYNSAVFIYF